VVFHRRRKHLWLHESTQRRLCRLSLFLFAILPLCSCFVFVAVSKTEWYQLREAAYWRERIRNNLGLDVVFSRIEFPAPNRFRIRELVCADPETKAPILYASQLDGWISGSGWSIQIEEAEIRCAQSELAIRLVHDSFLCRPHNLVPLLKLSLRRAILQSDESIAPEEPRSAMPGQEFHHVEVEYEPSLVRSQLKVQFSLAQNRQSAPALVHISRDHSSENPTTHWALRTGFCRIPCQFFSSYFPAVTSLGAHAWFQGEAYWWQDSRNFGCEIRDGRVEQIDLGVTTLAIGSPIHGNGQLRIARSAWMNGQLLTATGAMSGVTQIRSDCLRESIKRFGWVSNPLDDLPDGFANVDECGIAFDIGSGGIVVSGTGKPYAYDGQKYSLGLVAQGKQCFSRESGSVVSIPLVHEWLGAIQQGLSRERIIENQTSLVRMLPNSLPRQDVHLTGNQTTIR